MTIDAASRVLGHTFDTFTSPASAAASVAEPTGTSLPQNWPGHVEKIVTDASGEQCYQYKPLGTIFVEVDVKVSHFPDEMSRQRAHLVDDCNINFWMSASDLIRDSSSADTPF